MVERGDTAMGDGSMGGLGGGIVRVISDNTERRIRKVLLLPVS